MYRLVRSQTRDQGCQADARLDALEVRPGSAVGTRFSTGTSPINGASSTPLDIVIPGQDTGAPIGTGFESMYENVGTPNGASSSPEWKVSHKEMRYGMKTCPVRDCGYAGNNIEKHVYVSHLPACLNPILTFTPGQPHLPEERWQAMLFSISPRCQSPRETGRDGIHGHPSQSPAVGWGAVHRDGCVSPV